MISFSKRFITLFVKTFIMEQFREKLNSLTEEEIKRWCPGCYKYLHSTSSEHICYSWKTYLFCRNIVLANLKHDTATAYTQDKRTE